MERPVSTRGLLSSAMSAFRRRPRPERPDGIGAAALDADAATRMAREIAELRDALREARHAATHDYLTGLLNRRAFDAEAEAALRAPAAPEEVAALLWLDLDGFKMINDRAGHGAGDAALKAFARVLVKACGPSAIVGRIGGDEFCVLQVGLGAREAERLGRLVQHDLANLAASGGAHLSASIGIAVDRPGRVGLAELMDRADAALYRVKSEGAGTVGLYSDARPEAGSDGRNLQPRDLGKAIAADELRLFYQPKFAARTRRVEGFEALVRWEHPERGLLPPMSFLPLAEHGDLMRALTDWTIRRAVADRATLLAHGCAQTISINISGRLLAKPDFAQRLLALTDGSAEGIGLEITETEIISDREAAVANLKRCCDLGFRIAIDDYGTGLSSLSYLKQLPAHELKIDRSFISQITRSHRDPLLVRSTIDLAHALDMTVTAEGVEAPAALALLAVMGCDSVQGFLLAEPMPLAKLLSFLGAGEAGEADGDAALPIAGRAGRR